MIDGGSTDGTLQVLKRYADRLAVLVSEPNRSIYGSVLSRIGAAFADPAGLPPRANGPRAFLDD